MQAIRSWSAVAAAALLLAACGGGGEDDPPSERATLLVSQLGGQALTKDIDAGTTASGLIALAGPAKCNVDVRYIMYVTQDPAGQPATATAGVLVPSGTDAKCSGNRPVVLYGHGTTFTRTKNMAQVSDTDPDPNVDNSDNEAKLVMAMFAAQGYIVVAPNFLGYDRSSLTWHPYLNAETSAKDMVDGLRAAKAMLQKESATKASNVLFITGYSQGGHVAMATHRAIERDYANEFTVAASGPMSGPHDLATMVGVMTSDPTNGHVVAGGTLFTPMLLTSYQKSYGGIYGKPADAYQAAYAASAETLFPTDTPIPMLISQGKLPADPTFTRLFGEGGLLTESFRAAYPGSNFEAAAKRNTLLGWTPKHPVALCYGANDPTVPGFNSANLAADFIGHGVPAQMVSVFNLETPAASVPAPVQPVFGGFQQKVQQVYAAAAATGGDAAGKLAVGQAYHGTLVPPFCTTLVRGFFDQVQASLAP
jgi:dienelactone hydrolase